MAIGLVRDRTDALLSLFAVFDFAAIRNRDYSPSVALPKKQWRSVFGRRC